MNLKSYCGKKVNIETTNGNSFSGTICDYFYPDENESGLESFVMETFDGDLVEFTKESIKTIKEI